MAHDDETCHLQWNKHLQNIGQLFYNLYSSDNLADVTISCTEGTVNAHKLVLSSCSPYFTRLFKNINQNTHPVFVMHGISLENMKIILEFMYRGKVKIPSHLIDDLMIIAESLEVEGFNFLNEVKVFKNGNSTYDNHKEQSPQPNEKKRKFDAENKNHEMKEVLNNSNMNESQASDRPQTRFKGLKRVPVGEVQSPESPEADLARFVPKKKIAKIKEEIKLNSIKNETKEIINGPLNAIANHSTPNRDTPTDILAITPVITLSEGDSVLECEESQRDNSPTDSDKTSDVLDIPKKDLKNYGCEFCSARFARISHLQRHRRMHTGEKPFHCKVCGKSFARQDKLKLHIRNQHSFDNYEPTPEKKPPILIGSPLDACEVQTSSLSSVTQSIIQSVNDISNNSSSSLVQRHAIKVKRRGRPRTREIHFQHERRPRGRPRKIAPKMESQENYDLATLPYGDFSYLTRELQQSYADSSLVYPGVSSPVVVSSPSLQNSDITIAQVKDSPNHNFKNSSDESANSLQITPITTPANNLLDSIRLIGECTIRPVT